MPRNPGWGRGKEAPCQLLFTVLVWLTVIYTPLLVLFCQRVNPRDDEDAVTTDETSQNSLKTTQNPPQGEVQRETF